ncbi:CpsD/CapB family tyrosine-protein kinase [uncultured Roseobacter sp.]|uniref:CpsD/CapB family tyrosine-protein kinase n=1 Tax=uncultured Roseobacter sp. TaxID=114847 RepID=UPI00260DC5D1|nr:CpsD/CapB family tyrosine-protein kinase [uncultured Roseobacter sp.]
MEKLQAALDKARKSREKETAVSDAVSVSPPPRKVARPTSLDAMWQNLSTFDVTDEQLLRHRVVTREATSAAAPFDILRTKVLLQMRQNGWTRLGITSPMPQSGKTTTACNLALGLGRQRDLRAILMDTDLRDPSVHEFFQTIPSHGIGELLSGQVGFEEQAVRIGDNVACSMAIQPESDPTRMLLAEETANVIARIEEEYKPDIMIFDLPSVLPRDDTRAFLKNVDCALIVIRANTTRYKQFDKCEREVSEHTNVLGVVLNAHMNTSDFMQDE